MLVQQTCAISSKLAFRSR